jgi:hypothetical protein
MNHYIIHFRDFLHNRIDFSCRVEATDMKEAVRIARIGIDMPKYIIVDYIRCERLTQ